MLSEAELLELRPVLAAQSTLLAQLRSRVADLQERFTDVETQRDELAELLRQAEELERDAEVLQPEDLEELSPAGIDGLYLERQAAVASELRGINFRDWPSFVSACELRCLEDSRNPLAPYEALLTEADLARLRDESYGALYRWDRLDYVFVGAAGMLAALTDFLVVRIPKTLTSGMYAGQEGSPVTSWLRGLTDGEQGGFRKWLADAARRLEKECRVPYDPVSPGLGGGPRHRFQTLGHDPVLGFIFGIRDIMNGQMTGFRKEGGVFIPFQQPMGEGGAGLLEAFLLHVGHLFSDVGTKQGLPAPFMGLLLTLNVGSFGEKGRTVAELARWMYANGYDLRHFLTSGITPATVEIILRAYLMIRHYSEHGEVKLDLGSHPKYRTMLLMAHAVAASANAGRVVLAQGNPLAINYAQWLALFRYLVPSVRYWVLDRQRLELEHLRGLTDHGWGNLLEGSRELLARIPSPGVAPFELTPEVLSRVGSN